MAKIHPTAIVEPGAELADDVEVGAYSIVRAGRPHRRRHDVGPHCVIEGRTTIGRDNRISQFNSIGGAPQDKKYAGEPTRARDRRPQHDPRVLHDQHRHRPGRRRDADRRRQLDHGLRPHRARLPASAARRSSPATPALAGHVQLGDWAIVGGQSGLHQFVKIGAHAMMRLPEPRLAGRAAVHDGRRQPARGARLQRRGAAPARLRRRAHRRRQADAPAALPRGPDASRRRARAIAALAASDARGRRRRRADDGFLAAATRGIAR